MAKTVLRTPICDLLGIEYPVVLAGMGPTAGGGRAVASPELVAAVSNAGGLGVLGGAGASPDALRAAIRRVRELTDRPFGVDILLPSNVYRAPSGNGGARPDPAAIKAQIPEEYRRAVRELKAEFNLPDVEAPPPSGRGMGLGPDLAEAQVQVIFQERVPVLAVGLGNPAPYVPQARELGIKVIALVGNVKNARRVAEAGVDIVVAQGTEAGGHTGRVGTMALVPQVVDAVRPVPVLAAGGIGDGRGLAAALCLGAQGAWVGTAFIPTKESGADPIQKQRILEATEEDTLVTRMWSGKTMRNVSSPLMQAWEARNLPALPMGLQGLLVADLILAARQAGREDLLMNPAGQVAGMLRELRSAAEVLQEMVDGAVHVLRQQVPGMVTFST